MKKLLFISAFISVLLIIGCAPSADEIANAIMKAEKTRDSIVEIERGKAEVAKVKMDSMIAAETAAAMVIANEVPLK